MYSLDLVAAIYGLVGTVFLVGLALAVLTTGARVIYYVRYDRPATPRLLLRDILVMGSLALSFGLIVLVRFLPPDVRTSLTVGNVVWALITSIPAAFAMLVYCYYELVVVRRLKRGDV